MYLHRILKAHWMGSQQPLQPGLKLGKPATVDCGHPHLGTVTKEDTKFPQGECVTEKVGSGSDLSSTQ